MESKAYEMAGILALTLFAIVGDDSPGDGSVDQSVRMPQKNSASHEIDRREGHLNRRRPRRGLRGSNQKQIPRTSIGLTPISEMAGNSNYKGEEGGLYGKGSNEPPADHLKAALELARQISPLDQFGNADPQGRIGLVSIGMSNTADHFQRFMELTRIEEGISPSLMLVNGAQRGKTAIGWAKGEMPWQGLDQRLVKAGLSSQQVQVIWCLLCVARPAADGGFPTHVKRFDTLTSVVYARLKAKFPNLQIAYISSRVYAGYASGRLNPEPYAYEYGFGVRNQILRQIAGDPTLNYDPAKGAARAPLLLWGPYLWADGTTPRKSDDLTWSRQDFKQDGVHPSKSGTDKSVRIILDFFKSDPTAKPWFLIAG